MKLFVAALALCVAVAASAAVAPASDYLPPFTEITPPAPDYLPPDDTSTRSADGYRYKTVRRLKYRHRRDLSNEYLPPFEAPIQEYLPPETKLADDGYQYKTVRRLKYRNRHRRDVSDLPSNEYLPPFAVGTGTFPEENTDDGYHYKTVRRLRYRARHRRDVETTTKAAPSNEYLPPIVTGEEEPIKEKSAVLADDGYHYKTVRKLRYRYRH